MITKVNPDVYLLNHTYRFIEKQGSRKLEYSDVTAQDLATAAEALGVDAENIELVKVYKSSGKLGTAGSVSAGWSKCTESLVAPCIKCSPDNTGHCSFCGRLCEDEEQLSKAYQLTQAAGIYLEQLEIRESANLGRPVGELPCETCLKGETCDRSHFHVTNDDSGRLVCEQWELPGSSAMETEALIEKGISQRIAKAPAPAQIPQDLTALAKERAGTRAEVLDLNDISSGDRYYRQVMQGYAILDDEIRFIDDPEECLERCTHGFHFGFDSKSKEPKTIGICSDTKCLGKKKGAFTRNKNAEGQALKKAEVKAVKEAVTLTTAALDRGRLKLILLAQIRGKHTTNYFYGEKVKSPKNWLWDKVSPEIQENDRSDRDLGKLFAAISKLTYEELASLVVEFMLYYLMDHGDIGTYQLQVEEPLGWLGISIQVEKGADNGKTKKEG
ncbi:hypothetical protein ES703_70702 [subsurface metagenome]